MVLVKVIKLIVHIDWSSDFLFDINYNVASALLSAHVVVLLRNALDFIAHDVQDDAKSEENNAEDTENNHSGAERGYGSPCRQHLLLELAVLKLLNLGVDSIALLLSDFHLFFP